MCIPRKKIRVLRNLCRSVFESSLLYKKQFRFRKPKSEDVKDVKMKLEKRRSGHGHSNVSKIMKNIIWGSLGQSGEVKKFVYMFVSFGKFFCVCRTLNLYTLSIMRRMRWLSLANWILSSARVQQLRCFVRKWVEITKDKK